MGGEGGDPEGGWGERVGWKSPRRRQRGVRVRKQLLAVHGVDNPD